MDCLLTSNDRQEALSSAYVYALAAGAGYVVGNTNFDRDGVDLEIKAGGGMRPSLGVQLKATINLGEQDGGSFRFPLKRRNYDLLRLPTQSPRILAVLSLPPDEVDWLQVTPEQLMLRRCAFWCSLAGSPETENATSITVAIPASNVLDVDSLKCLMEQSRQGRIG